MRVLSAVCVFVLCLVLPALAADHHVPGLKTLTIPSADPARPVEVAIWYPVDAAAEAGRPIGDVGAGAVFWREQIRRDAEPEQGRHRVVLLSHGGLRSAPHLGDWLAAGLAERGLIVVSVQSPRLSSSDAAEAVAAFWLRADDLSRALTAALADPLLVEHATADPVGIVGLLRGGTAGLMLAGGRLDAEQVAASCDPPAAGPDCRWFADHGVNLRQIDRAALEKSRRDARIGWVVAVFPEMTNAFGSGSKGDVPIDILGREPLAKDEMAAKGSVDDVSPFDAFPMCTPDGEQILKADDDDDGRLCAPESIASRRAFHERVIARVLERTQAMGR